MLKRAKYAATATALAAGVASLSACGDPITANHDWQAFTGAVTITSTVAEPGATINEQDQILSGKIAVGDGSSGRVVPNTTLRVTCIKIAFTRTEPGPAPVPLPRPGWNCQLLLNTGQRFYAAGGQTADGVFGTFKSLDSKGSGTITVSKIREVQPSVVKRAVGDVPTGGKFYLVRVAARIAS